MLRCVTCYFNVNNSDRVKNHFIEFRNNFNAPLTVVELAFDDQPFWIDDSIQIRGDSSHLMWQKERLLNIGIQSLPPNVDKVAWVDADIIFEDLGWFKKLEERLDYVPVCQVFNKVYENNSNNDPVNNDLGYAYKKTAKDYTCLTEEYHCDNIGKTGLAWAARRDMIPEGINDFCIVGNADIYQLLAWEGAWQSHYYDILPPTYRMELLKSSFHEFLRIKGKIGCVMGTIRHLEHGTLSNRRYIEKQQILNDHNFSVEEDIAIDENGLWKWNSDKPDLHAAVKDIFYTRHEDE